MAPSSRPHGSIADLKANRQLCEPSRLLLFPVVLMLCLGLGACGNTTYAYQGPVFDVFPSGAPCQGCSITGNFVLSRPLAFSNAISTYPDIRALNITLVSFDFTISGLAGAPHWTNTNGALIRKLAVTLNASGNIVNWYILLASPTTDSNPAVSTCNALPAFGIQPRSHLACDQPPGTDSFNGTGGSFSYTGAAVHPSPNAWIVF
jgi:hypothetical protein